MSTSALLPSAGQLAVVAAVAALVFVGMRVVEHLLLGGDRAPRG